KNGEEDFWTQVHAGGMVCFDNADTRTDWLADALAADAGLADRLLVVRLERRTDETAEAALSDEIAVHRDAGLSWIADLLSVALADKQPVPGGLNKRHPDFSALAVCLGRAMGKEQEAVDAIRNAEADKSLFNLENDEIGNALIELMRSEDTFAGTAAELLEQLKKVDPSFEGRLSAKRLSKRLGRLWPHLAAIFGARQDKGHGGINQIYFRRPNGGFGGFETAFSEKSYERTMAGRNAKTPLESHQSNQEPLFEDATPGAKP
ncbi:MAG: hypothetical protein KKE37_07950, partial [Verrucomicrobia bacterium]|nr:hypothetical protein [Verrucomicrobiota bacterium]